MHLRKKILIAAALAMASSSSIANADTVAVSLAAQNPNIVDNLVRNVGWEFTTNAALQVTSLGVYDPSSYSSSIKVGIFTTSGTLLDSVTVPAKSSSSGQFQYVSLSSPLALAQGQAYIIDAFIGSEHWLAPSLTTVSVNSAISIAPLVHDWYTCCENVGFEFPGGTQTGASYSGTGDDDRSYLGPNFQFSVSAVPEPSTWAMLLLGFAGIGVIGYRRKSRPAMLAA